jgi:hypothetical protein
MTTILCERVQQGSLKVEFVFTKDQIIDGFTRALTGRQLEIFWYNLNLE